MAAPRNPEPAYPAKDSRALYGDTELYARLGATAYAQGARQVIEDFEVPIRSGKAWIVPKGMCCISLAFDVCKGGGFRRSYHPRIVSSTRLYVKSFLIWTFHDV